MFYPWKLKEADSDITNVQPDFLLQKYPWYISCIHCCCLATKSCLTLLWPHGLQPTRLLCPRDFPVRYTGVGCHFLLQEIFPTKGSKPSLLHWQANLLPLSHLEALYVFIPLIHCQKAFIAPVCICSVTLSCPTLCNTYNLRVLTLELSLIYFTDSLCCLATGGFLTTMPPVTLPLNIYTMPDSEEIMTNQLPQEQLYSILYPPNPTPSPFY